MRVSPARCMGAAALCLQTHLLDACVTQWCLHKRLGRLSALHEKYTHLCTLNILMLGCFSFSFGLSKPRNFDRFISLWHVSSAPRIDAQRPGMEFVLVDVNDVKEV